MCLECLLHAPNSKIDIIFKLMAEKPKVSQLGEYQYSLNGHNVSLAKRGGQLVWTTESRDSMSSMGTDQT